MKRYKLKPIIISQKQKYCVEELNNFTKSQLTKKKKNMKWTKHQKKDEKKGNKDGLNEFLIKLKKE